MSVHYKFKASNDHSTVTFDGIHISVADLKKEIIEQKKLAKNADFDLQIQNAQTKDVYEDEATLIPKNTSVIVARIPIVDKKKHQQQQGMGFGKEKFVNQQRNHLANLPPSEMGKGVDISSMNMSEEEKIQEMMNQSTADYDPSRYMKIRGQNQYGRVPDSYRCHNCHQPGHWVKNCPLGRDEVKKSTGIPKTFMVLVDGPQVPGALITPEGQYVVPAVDHEAYQAKNKAPAPEPPPKPNIPQDLICLLCQDLLSDAVMVPCCAVSYCDECIRGALLESDDHECPGCHEKDVTPTNVIPNRFLRTAVASFKNDTGYSKPSKIPLKIEKEKEPPANEVKAAPERKISVSLDELQDDFPQSPVRGSSSESQDLGGPADTKDIYDFNDGSVPPIAPCDNNGKFPSPTLGLGLLPPPALTDFSQPPPNYLGPPPLQQHGRPSPYGHGSPQQMVGHSPPNSQSAEPPPPGIQQESSMRHGGQHSHHGPDGFGHPPPQNMGYPPPGIPPHHMMPPGGPPPHGSYMQPPPGFGGPGPHGMHGPPPMMGGPGPYHGPPPGPYGPPHGYNRYPPPGDMYGPRSYQGDRYGPRDDYRNRGSPRRPFHRDYQDRNGRYMNDENRPGAIDDPLKEFERIMREKDRRKQMRVKRSRSRTPPPMTMPGSPPPRRSSRSSSPSQLNRPASPQNKTSSPKRPRISPPPVKRYSRSRSRSPPPSSRQLPTPRSRSPRIERKPDSRRRASPPSSRSMKREEYYDHHNSSSSRYDERDRERDRRRQARLPPPRSHRDNRDREESRRERLESPSSANRHESHRDKYDHKPSSSSTRSHHGSHRDASPIRSRSKEKDGGKKSSASGGSQASSGQATGPEAVSEGKGMDVHPGTEPTPTTSLVPQQPEEQHSQPSPLLELSLPPTDFPGFGSTSSFFPPDRERDRRHDAKKSEVDVKTRDKPSETITLPIPPPEKKEHKRRKSSEEKKLKKDKKEKKHHRKKDKDKESSDEKHKEKDKEAIKEEKEVNKPRNSDDGSSGVASVFSNPFPDIAAKREKQKINIKLSTTPQIEKDENVKDSSEEISSGIPISFTSPMDLELDPLVSSVLAQASSVLVEDPHKSDDDSPKRKKKAKKRKSDSSSSSSSSSSDEKHKRKKKAKKHKKKKKKKSK